MQGVEGLQVATDCKALNGIFGFPKGSFWEARASYQKFATFGVHGANQMLKKAML